MAAPSLEERVAVLEAQIKQLNQQQTAPETAEGRPWWEEIVGIYQDDPAFDEAERLGREWRESSHPSDYEDGKQS